MKIWITSVLFCFTGLIFGQCPNTELFDLDLTIASDAPEWVNCIDNASDPDDFTLELISPNDILNYTVDWGDGSPLESGASLTVGNTLPHVYTSLGIFTVTLTEIQNGCSNTITGTLVSDRKPGATAQPPTNNTNGCVPHILTFINQSTNISQFTEFLWEWGDGTTTLVTNAVDPGAVGVPISHIFVQGTSDCGMEVRLTARSLCDTSFVVYGPFDFYDLDTAAVNVSNAQLCVGDFVTFDDVSDYNCIPGTRRIRWDLSDFGGGITPWVPAIPANRTQQFFIDGPIGSTFEIALEDSNFCGVDRVVTTVEIIAPPTSLPVIINDSICEGETAQFENQSNGGANSFQWDFGDGSAFSNSTNNLVNHIYSDSGSFTVELIADVEGSLMCSDTAEVEVFVKPSPEVSFSATTDVGCDEIESILINTSPDLVTWSWDFGLGADSLDQDSVSVNYNTKGYFIISLTGENDFNCTATSSDTLLVLPEPKIVFAEDSVCFGEEYLTNNQSTIDEFPSGTIIAEQWLNISGSNLTSLTGNARYPGSPDESTILTSFDIPSFPNTNNGYRVQGFIRPEESGLYKLFIASDDQSLLNLSTNEDPANKVEIASVGSFTSHLQWDKFASQESDFIQLDSGQYYYIEAIVKNGGGQGNLSVGWQLPSGQLERPLPGNYLTPFFDGLVITDWSWDFGDGTAIITERNPSHIFNGSGEFNVTLEASTGVCSSIDSLTILVAQEIDTTLIFSDTSACSPLELEIIDSTNALEIQFVYGDSERDTISHVLGDTITHTYFNNTSTDRFFNLSATIFGEFGCSENLIQGVQVFPIPITNVALDLPTPPCAPFELNAGNNAFDDDLLYTWSYKGNTLLGDSSVSVVVENQSVSLRFDTLFLDVENTDGCRNIEENVFNVFPEPDYSVVVEPDSGCSPLDVEFILNNGAQSYLWDFGDGQFSNDDRPLHTFELTGQDTITFNVSVALVSPFSCADTLDTKVFVQEDIVSDFIVSPKVQTYPDTTIQLLSLNSGPIVDTLWTIGDSIIIGTLEEFAYDTIGDHIITQTVTNQFCSQSHSDTITILPPVPTAQFSGGGTGCIFANYQFTNESTFATDFFWDFGDGETSTEEDPEHVYTTEGLYNVKLIVTGPGGVDSVTTFNVVDIVEAPLSIFTVEEDTLYQPDSVFTFDNMSTGDITDVIWSSGNEDTLLTGNQVQFSYGTIGTYEVSLIVSNNFINCKDTSQQEIALLPPLPIASFIGGDTACAPLSVSFTNTSTNALIYKWDFGDGEETFQENPTHVYDSVGVFNVKLVATNLLGVDSTITVGVVQVLEKPSAEFLLTEDTLIYPDTIFSIQNTSFGNVTRSMWSVNSLVDTMINEIDFQLPIDQLDQSILTLDVSNDFENCTSSFSDTLVVLPPIPSVGFTVTEGGCAPVEVEFTNQSTFGNTYFWDFGDGRFSEQENPTHTYFESGSYNVKLVASNSSGKDSIIRSNVVEAFQTPNALYITNPSNGEELIAPVSVFFNNKSENGTSYLWDFDDGTFSTDEKPLHDYSTPGEYFTSLIVSTDEGCQDTFNLVPPVIVINGGKFVVPNAFSPSPDGPSTTSNISEGEVNNDIFFPKISGEVEQYKLFVYNRWGELLFVSEDPNVGWDGYYKGNLSKQDVYVYRIEIQFETGESEVILGDFSLIR